MFNWWAIFSDTNEWNLLLTLGVVLDCCLKLFSDVKDDSGLTLFESGQRTVDKQETHTIDAAKLLELRLKHTLLGLVHKMFGNGEFCFVTWDQSTKISQLFICSVNWNKEYNFLIKVCSNKVYSEPDVPQCHVTFYKRSFVLQNLFEGPNALY